MLSFDIGNAFSVGGLVFMMDGRFRFSSPVLQKGLDDLDRI